MLCSCREDEYILPMQDNVIGQQAADSRWAGMYILNEGNMGSNKCTIDYLDLSASDGQTHYMRNIFSSRNPSAVKELGDVGNDMKIYGSKLWITVNCSNKVEVCSADSCRRIAQIDIPNCRYFAFDGRYAFVSSFAGPVQAGGSNQLGRVYKIDTLTLEKTDSCTVGYQPEEMVVVNGKLYVANSGGYRQPDYDSTISVVDIASMTEERKIDVACNLHRLRADRHGQLWVSSRGNKRDISPRLCWLAPGADGRMQRGGEIDVAVSDMCIVGDTLYYIGVTYNELTMKNTRTMGLVNVRTHQHITTSLFSAPQIQAMVMPHAIAVNPHDKSFFLMDAKNYVSSGELLHFSHDGTFLWRTWTGDIPSCAAFTTHAAAGEEAPADTITTHDSRYILAVDEYMPAPGQHVNMLPMYSDGDTYDDMLRKCTEAIGNNRGGMVTLGGWGGYITFHFDHAVRNVSGEHDIYIMGNAFTNTAGSREASSEPGIVMVSQDTNGNGLPDDTWYELAGSADTDSAANITYGYSMTYYYAEMQDIPWRDNRGASGAVRRNAYHTQEYFPEWAEHQLTFHGTLLPPNGSLADNDSGQWLFNAYRYGYADNHPNTIDGRKNPLCMFDIDWAVDQQRRPVSLSHVDFIRVYSATNQQCGWLGEVSTEICGAEDLHP